MKKPKKPGNPNLKRKWSTRPVNTVRLPDDFHAIAIEMCHAIDKGEISIEQIQDWLEEMRSPQYTTKIRPGDRVGH